jgi:hypothetical protein
MRLFCGAEGNPSANGATLDVYPDQFQFLIAGANALSITDGMLDCSGMTTPTEIKVNMYSQATIPALDADGKFAFWWDTDDNKLYLIARNNGTTKSVELA